MPDRSGTKAQPCPQAILDLTERFDLHRETYQRETYNETQARREFIDPFFTELGWDVDNKQGHAEAYKEVIHEDEIKVGGSIKAPDYCFRIGGGINASNEYCYRARIGYDPHRPEWRPR
jgi:predicted type IV restriction endonuclease